MSELTQEERRNFTEFCDELLSAPNAYQEICDYFTQKDSSFEYLFLFQRVKISASTGAKALVKTIKEIRTELRATQMLEKQANQQYVEDAPAYNNPFDAYINQRPVAAVAHQVIGADDDFVVPPLQ